MLRKKPKNIESQSILLLESQANQPCLQDFEVGNQLQSMDILRRLVALKLCVCLWHDPPQQVLHCKQALLIHLFNQSIFLPPHLSPRSWQASSLRSLNVVRQVAEPSNQIYGISTISLM